MTGDIRLTQRRRWEIGSERRKGILNIKSGEGGGRQNSPSRVFCRGFSGEADGHGNDTLYFELLKKTTLLPMMLRIKTAKAH